MFFTLSAYLITTLLMREASETGSVDVAAFYVRRALRIWPLYFGFLALVAIGNHLLSWRFFAAFSFFIGNFYVDQSRALTAAVVMWSICVEEQFYLVWPIVVKHFGKHLIAIAISMWIIAIIARPVLLHFGVVNFWENPLYHLDSLAAGALLALLRIEHVRYHYALILVGFSLWPVAMFANSILAVSLVAPSCAMIIVGTIDGPYLFRSRPVVYLGSISYGLYVFHESILSWLRVFGCYAWAIAPLSLVLAITCAAASYRYYEAPFLRLKRRFQLVESGAEMQKSGSLNHFSESGRAA